MAITKSFQSYQQKVSNRHLGKISLVSYVGVFKGCLSRSLFRCDMGHEWVATINSISSGTGCSKCSGKYHYTQEECIAQIDSRNDVSFVSWVDRYENVHSKANLRCAEGHEWSASIGSLRYENSGCPHCAGVYNYTGEERISQLNSIKGMVFVKWLDGYKNSYSKAIMRCEEEGHEWVSPIHSMINGGTRCPHCSIHRRAEAKRRPEKSVTADLNSLKGMSFVRFEGEYTNCYSKVVMRCKKCGHEGRSTVDSLLYGRRGCRKCATYGYNQTKPGTLYVLRSSDGAVAKIGISNNVSRRHGELKRKTPFDWECIGLIHHDDGEVIAALEKAFHGMTEQANMPEKFDGFTEWRVWKPEIGVTLKEWGDAFH